MEEQQVSSKNIYDDVLKSEQEYIGLCASLIDYCKSLFEGPGPDEETEDAPPTAASACNELPGLHDNENNKLHKEERNPDMEGVTRERPMGVSACNEEADGSDEMKANTKKTLWKRLFGSLHLKKPKKWKKPTKV